MSERIEQLIRDYPKMKTEQRCLFHQISDFRGITEQEMIDTMYFSQPEGNGCRPAALPIRPPALL